MIVKSIPADSAFVGNVLDRNLIQLFFVISLRRPAAKAALVISIFGIFAASLIGRSYTGIEYQI